MPQIINKKLSGSSRLIVWEITEDLEFFESRVSLPDKLHENYLSIGAVGRRREWLVSKYIIQSQISGVEMYYSERKLCLKNTDLKVSISHTDKYCCVMFSDMDCGVDIESTNRNFDRVAKRFLNENEREFIISQREKCVAWCAKEALYKKINVKEIEFKDDFVTTCISNDSVEVEYKQKVYKFKYFNIGESIVCTSC